MEREVREGDRSGQGKRKRNINRKAGLGDSGVTAVHFSALLPKGNDDSNSKENSLAHFFLPNSQVIFSA